MWNYEDLLTQLSSKKWFQKLAGHSVRIDDPHLPVPFFLGCPKKLGSMVRKWVISPYKWGTPLKINMEPKNHPLDKQKRFQPLVFGEYIGVISPNLLTHLLPALPTGHPSRSSYGTCYVGEAWLISATGRWCKTLTTVSWIRKYCLGSLYFIFVWNMDYKLIFKIKYVTV